MLKDKSGNRLYRKVTVKVIFPDEIFKPRTYISHAGARQGFNQEGIENILVQVADQLETLYPWWNFRVIELASISRCARFVYAFAGYSSQQQPDQVDMKDFVIPSLTEA